MTDTQMPQCDEAKDDDVVTDPATVDGVDDVDGGSAGAGVDGGGVDAGVGPEVVLDGRAEDGSCAAAGGDAGCGADGEGGGAGGDGEAEGGESDDDSSSDQGQEPVDRELELAQLLAERTEDLQRLHAEYANYKKRVDRDRALAREKGIEDVVEDLMPVFDAIDQAFVHEEPSEGFTKIVDMLVKAANKNGLFAYGEVGEVFDPHIHEALMQRPGEGTTEPTVGEIFVRGYKLNDRVLRPARVIVDMPADDE